MSLLHQRPGADTLKRKELSRAEDIAWTTARCNRLLRTIESRIETIRNLHNLIRPDFQAQKTAPKPQIRKQKPESLTDPVWLPTNGAKKTKARTYARSKVSRTVRSKESSRDSVVHTISLPSPFVQRVQRSDAYPAQKAPAQDRTLFTAIRSRVLKKLPVKIEDPVQKAESALNSAFKTFLSTTHAIETTGSHGARRGARGLLGTCLRQIPQYIESQTGDVDDAEDEAVTSDVWSFFDDLLEIKLGWQGLREVARSQGVDLVRRAILDHALSDSCIDQLITSCKDQGALPELEILFSAFLESGDTSVSAAKLRLLESVALSNSTEGIMFRVLTHFAMQDCSCIAAILTSSKNIWNTLLRATIRDAQDEALRFLRLCIEFYTADACALQGTDARSRQIIKNLDEVASKLSTMAYTSLLLSDSNIYGVQLREGLSRLGSELLASKHTCVSKIAVSWLHGPVLLSALTGSPPILTANSLAMSEAYDEAARNPLYRRTADRRAQDFALSVASDLFSLDAGTELEIINSVFTNIKQYVQKSTHTATTRTLRAIATELLTRRRLDDGSADDKDSESSICQIPKTPSAFQTPARRSRFDWDDDFCEWVAKTPFTKEVPSNERRIELNDKENQCPDTPDVLTSTIANDRGRMKRTAQYIQGHTSGSAQVIIARAAKRRKSDRVKARQLEEESEDELAA